MSEQSVVVKEIETEQRERSTSVDAQPDAQTVHHRKDSITAGSKPDEQQKEGGGQLSQSDKISKPGEGQEQKDAPPSSRRLLVLLHGEKAGDPEVREAINKLRKEGHEVTVRVTYEAGDVDRLVREAILLNSADTLVAAGGDGTVNETVAALLSHSTGLKDSRRIQIRDKDLGNGHELDVDEKVPVEGNPPQVQYLSVAVLPMGTSNDFAATTGIPSDPYKALLLATRDDTAKPIDVGLLNKKVFMNTATIGVGADVQKVTSSGLKSVLGPAAFLFTGAQTMSEWHPVSSVLRFPDTKNSSSPKLPIAPEPDAVVTPERHTAGTGSTAGPDSKHGAGAAKETSGSTAATADKTAGNRTNEGSTTNKGGNAVGPQDEDSKGKLAVGSTNKWVDSTANSGSAEQVAKAKPGSEGTANKSAGAQAKETGGAVKVAAGKQDGNGKDDSGKTTSDNAADMAAAETGTPVNELYDVQLLHATAANNRQVASMVSVSPDALLDDGLLDVIYLTGTPEQQATKLLSDMFTKGLDSTSVAPTLLKVPWLEIETKEAMEWSTDGEPASEPSNTFRFSILHRAVKMHLPDDRMLLGSSSDAGTGSDVDSNSSQGKKRKARKQRRGKAVLRPAPTMSEMLGSVVKFGENDDEDDDEGEQDDAQGSTQGASQQSKDGRAKAKASSNNSNSNGSGDAAMYWGVAKHRRTYKVECMKVHIGYCTSAEDAAKVHDAVAWRVRGRKARLNFDADYKRDAQGEKGYEAQGEVVLPELSSELKAMVDRGVAKVQAVMDRRAQAKKSKKTEAATGAGGSSDTADASPSNTAVKCLPAVGRYHNSSSSNNIGVRPLLPSAIRPAGIQRAGTVLVRPVRFPAPARMALRLV